MYISLLLKTRNNNDNNINKFVIENNVDVY